MTDKSLAGLLERVFDHEPPIADGVEAVYRRAEAIRRRRLRTVIAAGAAAVLIVAAIGYLLTAAVIPASAERSAAGVTGVTDPPADPALQAVRRAVDKTLRVVPREPARGEGWRQYTVLHRQTGRPRGLIEVSVYAAPDGLCFPVLADRAACARPERAGDHVQYVRYALDRDVDWQVHQAIARRPADGRVVAVMATGERGTGDAAAGRPPLSARQTAMLAADARLMAAFAPGERCNGPDPACPILRVPVPVDR
jgi:hypothetical protein